MAVLFLNDYWLSKYVTKMDYLLGASGGLAKPPLSLGVRGSSFGDRGSADIRNLRAYICLWTGLLYLKQINEWKMNETT